MTKWTASQTPTKRLLEDEALISIADTMRVLKTSRSTVNNLMNDGTLTSVKLGSRRLINTDSVRQLIDDNQGGAA